MKPRIEKVTELRLRNTLREKRLSMNYIITDGKGYWVSRRNGFDFWSSKAEDAKPIHFKDTAEIIARSLPVTMEARVEISEK